MNLVGGVKTSLIFLFLLIYQQEKLLYLIL
jgi:hypothetical protein